MGKTNPTLSLKEFRTILETVGCPFPNWGPLLNIREVVSVCFVFLHSRISQVRRGGITHTSLEIPISLGSGINKQNKSYLFSWSPLSSDDKLLVYLLSCIIIGESLS